MGALPIITRDATIDATGAGVIIDGDGGGPLLQPPALVAPDVTDNGTPCGTANLLTGVDAHGNAARPCDGGLEVSATHNNFGFTLLGNGGQNFVI